MLDPLPFSDVDPHFCPRDGTPLGDELKGGKIRRVCPECGYIYGRDPRVIIGLIARWDNEWLFVWRNVGGRELWTLPLYPCRDRRDARIMLAEAFESEMGLHVQAGSAVDTFNVDTDDLGPVMVVLFDGKIVRADLIGHANLRAAKATAILASDNDLSRQILTHLQSQI